ncbi:MAG: AAA family ATPase [Oscillospiraceae bacterium]|nr:AAA family ATPase [Oscillospiraceae bacterium]
MRIKELHIEKFGTIRNLTINTSEKLNYVYGLNEAEKTTVIDFIEIMLYGTVNNYREDIREKYLPDDGSDMYGSIVFEHKGDEITLERVFNAGRYKKDTIKITNNTKGTSEELPYNVRPGEYLFNASKEIFRRNSYINESESVSMMKTSHTRIMSSLLSNLISTASETTSVSDVARMLNSYCDPADPESITFKLGEKKSALDSLKEELKSALETEEAKIEHQLGCNKLHTLFAQETRKYEKIKTSIEIQDMISEIETLKNDENSEENFQNTSEKFNETAADLKRSRVLENRNAFDKAHEKYKRLKSFYREQLGCLQREKNLNVELGRYTPKGDPSSLNKVIELQDNIEQCQDTINALHSQLSEKQSEMKIIQEKVIDAKEKFEEAENALVKHDEMSRHKIAHAENSLHDSSETIEVKPITKSKNLIFAVFVLAVLVTLLIIFITNIFAVVILGAGILSVLYTIFIKIGKEKKVKQYSRIDENQLRSSQIALRNLKNSCSEEHDKFASKSAYARNQYEDIKKTSHTLKKQISSLENEIANSESNIQKYKSLKEEAEKNITHPDPKFYSIRSEINDIHREIKHRETEIEVIRETILSDLSSIRNFQNFEDAENFIEKNAGLLAEHDKLTSKLSVLGNTEKARIVQTQNQQRINELTNKINKITHGKDIEKATPEEYETLKQMSQKLLEEISDIKDNYISAITNMKIQYNDSKCVANLEKEILSLEKEVEKTDGFVKSVKIAIDAYNDSLYEVREKYAPAVARRTSEILSEITEEKYSSISIKGGKIVVKDKNKNPVNFETISKSTCDQIYFALRLAVSEVTSGNFNYPVILDDIFFRFSETKSVDLLNFLIKYSEKTQIIIFNNSNRISSVISQNQIPIDNINMISI